MTDEVLNALKAIRAEVHTREQATGYAMCSVRSVAGELGYAELLPEILAACVEGGFEYCLDHTIAATSYNGSEMKTEYPSQNVCYWGADQLRSRLDCVDHRLYS